MLTYVDANELERRIQRTALPEIWASKRVVTARLFEYLEKSLEDLEKSLEDEEEKIKIKEKVKKAAESRVWLFNPKVVNLLVSYLERSVKEQKIGPDYNTHLTGLPIEIYFVFYKELPEFTRNSIEIHLEGCEEECLPEVKEKYERGLWGDLAKAREIAEKRRRLVLD